MLLYFILGIVFIYICIPIIDNLLSIFSTWCEYKNYTFVAKVLQIKKKYHIDDQKEEEEECSVIGFSYPEPTELEIEEQEEGLDQDEE